MSDYTKQESTLDQEDIFMNIEMINPNTNNINNSLYEQSIPNFIPEEEGEINTKNTFLGNKRKKSTISPSKNKYSGNKKLNINYGILFNKDKGTGSKDSKKSISSNNSRSKPSSKPKKKEKELTEILDSDVSRLNQAECINYQKQLPSIVQLRIQMETIKKNFEVKLEKAKKEKPELFTKEDEKEKNKPEESKENNTSNNQDTKENQNSTLKSKFLFKLFYKNKQLQSELNIIQKTTPKSIMRVNFFLDNREFLGLNIKDKFELCAKLLKSDFNSNDTLDEDSSLFFERLSKSRIAFVEDDDEFYAIISSINKKITDKLDFPVLSLIPAEDIAERNDLILILRIFDIRIVEKIKFLLSEGSNNNTSRTVLSQDDSELISAVDEGITPSKGNPSNVNSSFPCPNPKIKTENQRKDDSEQIDKLLKELEEYKLKEASYLEKFEKERKELSMRIRSVYDKDSEDIKEKYTRLTKEKDEIIQQKAKLEDELREAAKQKDDMDSQIAYLKEKYNSLDLQTQADKEALELNSKLIETQKKKIRQLMKGKQSFKQKSESLAKELEEMNESCPKVYKFGDMEVTEIVLDSKAQSEQIKVKTQHDYLFCLNCSEKPREIMLMSCKHLVYCWDCFSNFKKEPYMIDYRHLTKLKNTNSVKLTKGKVYNCPICSEQNKKICKAFHG